MKKRTFLKVWLPLATLGLLAPHASEADGGFNVVVNKANGVASLTKSELKRLATGGTKTWGSGAGVQLGVIPGEAAETGYLASTLDTSPHELLSLIQQQVFKGELRRPVVLRSSADCIAMASGNPGAICIASAGSPVGDGARVVPIR